MVGCEEGVEVVGEKLGVLVGPAFVGDKEGVAEGLDVGIELVG